MALLLGVIFIGVIVVAASCYFISFLLAQLVRLVMPTVGMRLRMFLSLPFAAALIVLASTLLVSSGIFFGGDSGAALAFVAVAGIGFVPGIIVAAIVIAFIGGKGRENYRLSTGLAISIGVHGAVLTAGAASWPNELSECDKAIAELRREQPGLSEVDILIRLPQCASVIDVPVDFVEIGLVTDIAAIQKVEEAPPEEEPVPEEQPEEEAPPEEEPVDEPEVNEVKSTPVEEEEEIVIPDEQAKPEEAPKKEPPKKEPPKDPPKELIRKQPPKEQPDDLDFLNEFEDLLKDKAESQRAASVPEAPPRINKPVLQDVQQPRKGAGEQQGNTASLQAAMRMKIIPCWDTVADLPKEDQINVIIRLKLNKDGTIAQDSLVNPRSRPAGRKGLAVDRAQAAVRTCAPYKMPLDDYDLWQDINVVVGPQN